MRAATYLFVPAHEPRKVERAMTAGSDAVILDLEDSVPDSQKIAARNAASARARVPGAPELRVRVNADPRYFEGDLQGIDWRTVTGAIVPKASEILRTPASSTACWLTGAVRVGGRPVREIPPRDGPSGAIRQPQSSRIPPP